MEELRCSFCSKERKEVRKLISGPPRVFICDECITACSQIFDHEQTSEAFPYPRPKELVEELDRYCVGQMQAKRALSVAVYNHYKRISNHSRKTDVEIQKGNILLMGPTGCGKTLLAQTLAKKLDVPFAIADATTLTEAGYVGEDVESVIKSLFRNAGGNLEKTQKGIIFIDEIDKIARRGNNPSAVRDVGGEGVQQALLKLLEGKQAMVSPEGGRNSPQQELIQVDTKDILFICSGAFTGIEDIVHKRVQTRGMGFGRAPSSIKEDANYLRSMTRTEDLMRYGMIPEFLGRLPVLVTCDSLDQEALSEVLWRPKNSLIKQYQRLFSMEGINLQFTKEAVSTLAKEAASRQSGARGLRAIMEELMLDIMYEIPSMHGVTECMITEEVVLHKRMPLLGAAQKAS